MRHALLLLPLLWACDPTAPTPAPTEPETCEEVDLAIAAEFDAIASCTTDAQCGQELTGTSCGCTRNLVARIDADTRAYYALLERQGELGCDGLISTCDCPPADGFACRGGTCTWNYADGVGAP